MDLIKPAKLKKGDTVGIITPSKCSRPNAKERFDLGIKNFESFGLKVEIGKHVFDDEYYEGATIANRLSDLHGFFADPNIKMIMMVVGGYSSSSMILDQIDYELIRNNPKIFSGFCDGTLLVNAIYQRSGLVTFYGMDMQDYFSMDMSDKMRAVDTVPKKYSGWNVIKTGKSSGHLVGGYLPLIIGMDYIGYTNDMKDAILFFEGVKNIKEMILDLSLLKQRGVFDDINGMIVGYHSGVENQLELADMIKDFTQGYNFPIIQIGELGHEIENYSFPIGVNATIDTDNLVISIDENVLS